jgi:hypothetical protein
MIINNFNIYYKELLRIYPTYLLDDRPEHSIIDFIQPDYHFRLVFICSEENLIIESYKRNEFPNIIDMDERHFWSNSSTITFEHFDFLSIHKLIRSLSLSTLYS